MIHGAGEITLPLPTPSAPSCLPLCFPASPRALQPCLLQRPPSTIPISPSLPRVPPLPLGAAQRLHPGPRPSQVQPKRLQTWAPSGHLPPYSTTPGPWWPRGDAEIQGLPWASETPPPAMSDLQPRALGTAAAHGAGGELVILVPLERSQASSRTPPPVKNSSLTSLVTSAWGGSSSGEQNATGRRSASQPSGAWSSPGSLSPSSISSLLGFACEDNQGLLSCISAASYHTPSVCKALYPVSCFSQGWNSVPPLHLSPWPSAQLPPLCFARDRGVRAWRQLRAKPGKDLRSHALALALPKHLEAFQHRARKDK